MNVGNSISGSSAFSKPRLYTWKFLVHLLLKTSLKDFECYLASMSNECHWVGQDWVTSFSRFTFIKRLFSSSSRSAIRVVSSAYLRLLIFLLSIFIPSCASSSPAFLMMYSAYKLNKQGDNIQPWCTPFLIGNQPVVPCPVLTVASWPAYRFLRRQVRLSGIPISLRIFHSLLWSTQRL